MTVADGDVFVADAEGVQAFSAVGSENCSGTPQFCQPLWATSRNESTGPGFTPDQSASPVSTGDSGSPAVANGVLYIASTALYAFDVTGSANCSGGATTKTCAPLWTAPSAIGARLPSRAASSTSPRSTAGRTATTPPERCAAR